MDSYYTSYLAIYGAVLFGTLLFGVALYVISAIFMAKLFDKAGVEGTWRAWVPVYNMMVFFKLGDLSPWLVLYAVAGAALLSWIGIGFLFSLALYAFSFMAAYRIGMKLHQESGLVAMWIIPPLWLIVMSGKQVPWDKNIAPAQWAGNAFLADNTTWEGIPSQAPDPVGYTEIEVDFPAGP